MGGGESNPGTQNPVKLANNLFSSGLWIKPTIAVTNFDFLVAGKNIKIKTKRVILPFLQLSKICYCLSQTSADPQACFKKISWICP